MLTRFRTPATGLVVMFAMILGLTAVADLSTAVPAMAQPTLDKKAGAEADRPPFVDFKGRKSTHEQGKIKMTVFMDFFCSHCHHFESTVVPVLQKEYGDKLIVDYVGFPLVDPKASHIPVIAYYLADEQGKADAMRDALFMTIWDLRMDVTRPDILLGVADKAGLDLEAFKKGFNDDHMRDRLEQGIKDARAIKLRGTPTILLDNHIKMNDVSLRGLEGAFAKVLEADG